MKCSLRHAVSETAIEAELTSRSGRERMNIFTSQTKDEAILTSDLRLCPPISLCLLRRFSEHMIGVRSDRSTLLVPDSPSCVQGHVFPTSCTQGRGPTNVDQGIPPSPRRRRGPGVPNLDRRNLIRSMCDGVYYTACVRLCGVCVCARARARARERERERERLETILILNLASNLMIAAIDKIIEANKERLAVIQLHRKESGKIRLRRPVH
jgi:hypothetical protein